jgi:hypothetical protein
MQSFLIGLGLAYAGYQTALITAGYYVNQSNTITDLGSNMLRWVYCMTAVVFGAWYIFGVNAEYIISFAIAHTITLIFVDFETTFKASKDL